jgi:hypothetical protein
MLSAIGKGYALLWIIFLMCGSRPERMRGFLNCVFAINTDMGTERLVVDLPDILVPFLLFIGVKVQPSFSR